MTISPMRTGDVINSSSVLLRRSSAMRRMVMIGSMNKKNTVIFKNRGPITQSVRFICSSMSACCICMYCMARY
jgi:hypothetical protein